MPERPSGEDQPQPSRASALRYGEGHDAPVYLGTEQGLWAEKAVALAHKEGIPVFVNPELQQALEGLDKGQEIPEELFFVVAEIFAQLYRMKK